MGPSIHGKADTAAVPVLRERPGASWQLPVALLLLVLAIWVVYRPALDARALSFDDGEYLTGNPLVLNPGWASARQFLVEVLEPSTVHGYYQPLTMISLMADVAIGGRPDHLLTFHRTSLLLHIANACLVTLLLWMLFGRIWTAVLLGGIFGLHPMTVETIVWVGERKTLLAAFFALLSLIAYVRYVRAAQSAPLTTSPQRRDSSSAIWYGAVVLLYVLALMSKPTSTPLPLCMLLLDFWPLRRLNRRAVLEKLPLLLIGALSAWITYESQKRTAVTVLPSGHNAIEPLLIICHNIIFYLRNMVWPVGLSSHYPMPDPLNLSDRNVLAGVLGTLILVPLLILSLRWTRALLTGWLYFMVAIFPTLGVIGFTSVIAADKFAYLPVFGLLLPLGHGLARVWSRLGARAGVIAMCLVLGVLESLGTRAYLRQWSDTETLFRYMLAKTPNAFGVHDHLAHELARQGNRAEAIAHYQRTIELNPGYAPPYNELGILLLAEGRTTEAARCIEQALRLKPEFPEAFNTLGNVRLREGRAAEAESLYRKAIELKPHYADAHYNLANLLLASGRTDLAIAEYGRAISVEPQHFAAHKNLGSVFLQQGRTADAIREYQAALKVRSDWTLMTSLAWTFATAEDPAMRRPEEAVHLAGQAVELSSRAQPSALAALALAYGATGQSDRAVATAQEAMVVAQSTGATALVGELRAHLQKYLPASSTLPGNTDNPR